MYQLVQDFFPSTVGHQPFLHKSRFCFPFFFSSSTVWPMTFSEQHLWIPPPTETFEVPKIKWNFSFFFWIRDFCQNVACNHFFQAIWGTASPHFLLLWLGGPFTHFWPHRSGFDTGANTTVAEIGTRICGGSLDMIHLLGGGFTHFLFSSLPGEDSQFD